MRRPGSSSLLFACVCLVGCSTGVGTGALKQTTGAKASLTASSAPHVALSPVASSPTPGSENGASPQPSPAASAPHGPMSNLGVVLGLDGKPAVGVEVRGFLLSYTPSSLPGALGNVINGNGGGIVTGHYGLLDKADGPIETGTDGLGRFILVSPHGEALNVEAVLNEDAKAIVQNTVSTEGITLQLAHVGAVSGRVTAPGSPATTDLAGIDVFVPGTDYLAKTDAGGSYTLAGLATGTYTLAARRAGIGKGQVTGVSVKAQATTQAPDLALSPVVPVIQSVTPVNGGPGTSVTVTGDQFGASTGETVAVTFGGAAVTKLKRKDDRTLVVEVPAGAVTGDLTVTVDGLAGASKPFVVVKTLTVQSENHDFALGERRMLIASATDTRKAPVDAPVLTWSADSAVVDIDASGAITAKSAGKVNVTAVSGALTSLMYAIEVHPDPAVVTTVAGALTAGEFGRDPKLAIHYEGVGAGAEYHSPYGVAVGPDGNLYIADAGGWVSRTTPAGVVSKLAPLANARAIAVGPDNSCYVAAGNALFKVAPNGAVSPFAGGASAGNQDGIGTAAAFNGLLGLAIAKNGTLYAYDAGNSAIRAVSPVGAVTTLSGIVAPAVNASYWGAGPLAVGPDGSLYLGGAGLTFTRYDLTDPTHPVAHAINPVVPAVVAPDTAPRAPFGLAVDAHGNLFFTDPADGIGFVREIDLSDPNAPKLQTLTGFGGTNGSPARDGAASQAGFANTMGLAFDAEGALYVTEWGYERSQQRLRRITFKR